MYDAPAFTDSSSDANQHLDDTDHTAVKNLPDLDSTVFRACSSPSIHEMS